MAGRVVEERRADFQDVFDALSRCVFEGDTASLSRLPGIGKKTAERLVLDLRDRLDGLPGPAVAAGVVASADAPPATEDPIAEAVNALVALGLKPAEASKRVRAVDTPGLACEEIVRRALQSMVR